MLNSVVTCTAPNALEDAPADAKPAESSIKVAARQLAPLDIMFGGIWIGPGSGEKGDGNRPDLGQPNADATIQAAVDAGVMEFDTAPWYGAGASEERLGAALTRLAPSAKTITKVGRLFHEADGTPALRGFDADGRSPSSRVCSNDYTAVGADASLAHSLDRLGMAKVYGLRIHDPNDNSLNSRAAPSGVDEVAQVSAVEAVTWTWWVDAKRPRRCAQRGGADGMPHPLHDRRLHGRRLSRRGLSHGLCSSGLKEPSRTSAWA